MLKSYIKGIEYYLPEIEVTNEILSNEHPEWEVEKIESKTGIKSRFVTANNEFASDMAVKAANKLFETYEIDRNEIDFLLYCTQSPDYFLPTTACILQNKLCIPTSAGALDYNLGCSGYIYGLALAKGLISAGIAKNILLITSETYSKYINKGDKSNKTIFGDAASATLVSSNGLCEICNFSLGTDGNGAENLIVKEGGIRYPHKNYTERVDNYGNINSSSNLFMNGPEIFSFTSKAVPALINDVLMSNELNKEDIDLFIFHQANKFMLEHLRKKIGISENKFFYYIEKCGNTVSSTIPIALIEAIKDIKCLSGSKVLLAGFGVGYSWGGTVLKF